MTASHTSPRRFCRFMPRRSPAWTWPRSRRSLAVTRTDDAPPTTAHCAFLRSVLGRAEVQARTKCTLFRTPVSTLASMLPPGLVRKTRYYPGLSTSARAHHWGIDDLTTATGPQTWLGSFAGDTLASPTGNGSACEPSPTNAARLSLSAFALAIVFASDGRAIIGRTVTVVH